MNLGGYTPAELQYMGMAHLLYADPLALTPEYGVPHSCGPENAEPGTANPEPISPLALTLEPIVNRKSKIVHRKPRSKVFHLPPDIQLSLNNMLANGWPYRDIILSLNAQGYTGFNKVNLHNWKRTGYQTWLRSKTPEAGT